MKFLYSILSKEFLRFGGNMEENNLRLIVLGNSQKLGNLVNEHLKLIRKTEFDFIVPVKNPVFANSESKALVEQSVRAKDVFILGDIGNYEQLYQCMEC